MPTRFMSYVLNLSLRILHVFFPRVLRVSNKASAGPKMIWVISFLKVWV